MRDMLLILLFLVLALGGCAVTVSILAPTIDSTAHAWVQAETRTDPVDDLVRFREAERDGRLAPILLPVFVVLSVALLLLALAAPLPRLFKELRLLRKSFRTKPKRRRPGHPRAEHSQPWLEQPPPSLPGSASENQSLPPYPPSPSPPLLPPAGGESWLDAERP